MPGFVPKRILADENGFIGEGVYHFIAEVGWIAIPVLWIFTTGWILFSTQPTMKGENPMKKKLPKASMSFNGHGIRSKDGLVCLTDLWKAAGQPQGKRDPRRWKQEAGQQFIDSVARKMNVNMSDIYRAVRGRGGHTYAHADIAKEYKRYLSKPGTPKWLQEGFVRNSLVKRLEKEYDRVETEVKNPAGSVDILTPKEIIEVKNSKNWKSALGQVMVYQLYYPELKKRIHLFGNKEKQPVSVIEQVCKKFHVTVTWEQQTYL